MYSSVNISLTTEHCESVATFLKGEGFEADSKNVDDGTLYYADIRANALLDLLKPFALSKGIACITYIADHDSSEMDERTVAWFFTETGALLEFNFQESECYFHISDVERLLGTSVDTLQKDLAERKAKTTLPTFNKQTEYGKVYMTSQLIRSYLEKDS